MLLSITVTILNLCEVMRKRIHYYVQAGPLGNFVGRFWWEAVSFSADGVLFFLIIPAFLVIFPKRLIWHPPLFAIWLVGIGLTVDIALIVVLKQTFKRRRPVYHRPDFRFVGPDQFSFPSGHATRVWCFVGLVTSVTYAEQHMTDVLPKITVVWAALVSLGRIALGRHYATDVICGAMVGFFVTAPVSTFLFRRIFPMYYDQV